ncbi:MAG: tetratricopeptide repeat protein [Ktedonobacterales bacterium]|nr:tetratricopeptide repeat protein [Ktedonobacterales bacterium]
MAIQEPTATGEASETITVADITKERSSGERILIWLLRRWWALAFAAVGSALVGEVGSIGSTLFAEVANGQPLALPAGQSGPVAAFFMRYPVLAYSAVAVVAVLTVAAFFADRAEQTRLAHLATRAEEAARQERRRETRDTAQQVLQEFFAQQKAARQLATEGDEGDDDGGGQRRTLVLPPRPSLVLGRDTELARIATAITTPGVAAVSLRGLGGVGKSTLLLETLYRQSEAKAFPNGIIWLSCQELVEDDCDTQLYEAAGFALGLGEVAKAEGAANKAAALRAGLAGRRILIGLDNVEQPMPLDAVVATLTARGANGLGPTLLITTRVAWNDVAGLSEIDLDTLPTEEGFALLKRLVERSGKAISPDDAPAARAIIEAIGALPLAIELVAPRVARRAEPLAALATRLREEGVQLKGRTRGIERTFDLTYEQLTPAEQGGFAALAVLSGATFSQEAALAVMTARIGDAATPQVLLDLADLSLLRENQQPDGPPRYQLHPLVRQFARERLREAGAESEAAVELAAARHYRALVHRREARRTDTENQLDLEYPNVLGALTWAYQRMRSVSDPEMGKALAQIVADTAGDLKNFVRDRGYWTDGRRVLRWGAEADDRLGNRSRESAMLAALAFIVRQQGDLDEAERYYRQALEIARARKDRMGEAARTHNLGTLALMRGDPTRARALYEEALSARRAIGDEGGMSATLRSLGAVAAEGGDYDLARRYLRESLDLKKVQGISRGRTYTELGSVLVRDPQGDRQQARNLLETALQIARQHQLKNDEARALEWLGALELEEGHVDTARAHWEAALKLYQTLGASAAQGTRARLSRLAEAPVQVAAGPRR